MGHTHHAYPSKETTARRLGWSLGITAAVMVIEFAGGWLSGSIALVSDAGHMLTHVIAIGIGLSGIVIARRPRCHHRTFGLLRAEVIAAFVNALFLLGVTVWIVRESVERILNPVPIMTIQMLAIAFLGLTVNVASLVLLESSRHGDLNVRSVFVHMASDAFSSGAIVIAAFVIRSTGWTWVDPAVSIGIALLIVVWAGDLLRESLRVLLEMAPGGRNVDDISKAMRAEFPEITGTDREHVWAITPSVIIFSAHLTVNASRVPRDRINRWIQTITEWLAENFDVAESTLEVRLQEPGGESEGE